MTSSGDESEPLEESSEESAKNLLGFSTTEDSPPAGGELLFEDYDDGVGVDALLGISKDTPDDSAETEADSAPDDADCDSLTALEGGRAADARADEDEIDDDLLLFDEDEPDSVGHEAAEDDAVDFEPDDLVFEDEGGNDETTEPAVASPRARREPAADDDDTYWEELDRWVWDDDVPADSEPRVSREDAVDDDEPDSTVDDSDEDEEEEDRPRRRRGRRGRRGRQRRPATTAAESVAEDTESMAGDEDDSELGDVLFEDVSEDFVSVSQPESSRTPSRRSRADDEDTDEDTDDAPDGNADTKDDDDRPRRRRRGGRRPRSRRSSQRTVAEEDTWDEDDSTTSADGIEIDFEADEEVEEEEEERPHRSRRQRSVHGREGGEETRSSRSQRSGSSDSEGSEPSTRGEQQVTPEFRNVPSWQEAIACLALRSPGSDHADRRGPRGQNQRRRRS